MISTRHGAVAIHERSPTQDAPQQQPPLLLLHANPGDSRDYEAVLPAFSRAFRTIAVDWPGYGCSPAQNAEQLTAMAFADCLEDIVAALKVGAPDPFFIATEPHPLPPSRACRCPACSLLAIPSEATRRRVSPRAITPRALQSSSSTPAVSRPTTC